jgi:4-diphosphocytidyl-2-C-methyl-D-erythritol kinase
MRFRQVGPSLVVHTPAKLNLFLEILGKRDDGYHELETLMVTVNLLDTLIFTEEHSTDIRLRCSGRGVRMEGPAPTRVDPSSSIPSNSEPPLSELSESVVPAGGQNLVVKAAQLLREHAGVEAGVHITLVKRIPAAAGLAGGSSDAAATLMALNRFWKLKLGTNELQRLASQLGSDVAFFVDGTSAAVCHGRGEIIEPLQVPMGLHFVIARPWTGLSTAHVFKHCRVPERKHSVDDIVQALRTGRKERVGWFFHNALEEPAVRLNPEVKELKSRFSSLPLLGCLMSGSGTACFGLCHSRRQALSLASRLRAARVGHVWVAQTRP